MKEEQKEVLIIVKGMLLACSSLCAKALDGILHGEGESLGLGKLLDTVLHCSINPSVFSRLHKDLPLFHLTLN